MTIATTAAPKPMIRDVRAPWITRLRTSRPSSSVPSEWPAEGGDRKATLERSGSCGAITSASSAQLRAKAISASPKIRRGVRIMSVDPDLRVDDRVSDVGQEVHEHDADDDHHRDRQHHGKVVAPDGGHEQPPDAGHREYRLGDHGPAGELAQGQADERDHRQNGIGK